MPAALRALALLLALSVVACERPDAAGDALAKPPERALEPAEVARVYAMIEGGEAALAPELDAIVARGDHRFIAVLIEALRARQIGLLDGRDYNAHVVALERLSGQALGADWLAWVRWYQGTRLLPPPGFDAFKGRLLAKVDPTLAQFFAFEGSGVGRSEEIVWSGAPVERLGAEPGVAHAGGDEADLDGPDPVVGVALGGEARAYPLRWLDWHEVANDRLGGRDIAVVWCGFCASARAFDAGRPGGAPRRFAASGLLLRSVRLLYDGETRTLWNELTGAPALGPAESGGLRLDALPALLTTWRAWRERNPETTVLAPTAADRAIERGAPYARYHASAETAFPVALGRSELAAKDLVYGLDDGLRAKAWNIPPLLETRVLNTEIGDQPIVLVATRGRIELEATDGERTVTFSPGAEVRAYARGTDTFRPANTPDTLLDAAGTAWRATDTALEPPTGLPHRRLPGTQSYWFAWQAFHPRTEIGDGGEAGTGEAGTVLNW